MSNVAGPAFGFAFFNPRAPSCAIADGGSGISRCIRLALISLSGKRGGGADGFGIGGADGCRIVNPFELTCGDTTTEPDLGVGSILLDLLDAGVSG